MKKFYLFAVLYCCGIFVNAQTLFTYGTNNVSRDEFLRAYNKNKTTVTDKEKALREYLDLYTNFKLKVRAAEELRLDTIAQIRYDVQNFHDQIAENYLGDEKGIQHLVDEAAARSQKDLHIIYFSILVAAAALPADTLKAFNAAKEIYTALQKGDGSYGALAAKVSADYVPTKFANAGFITAFLLPYEFENIVYGLKPGGVAQPYRSGKGWYIFKVMDERPDAGKWRVAQVLFAYPPNADYNAKIAVKEKADSVYNLILKGMNFGEAAKKFSEDRITYEAQGELPEFSTGRYDQAFETQVFKLKADNEISRPFETPYGYHIVKRLSRTPLPADVSDAGFQFDTRQKVLQDTRINNVKTAFAKDVMRQTGFKKSSVSDGDLSRDADSLMAMPTIERTNELSSSKKTIITFKDGTKVYGDEWLKFVKDYKLNSEMYKGETNKQLWEKFAAQAALNYYRKNLEQYNVEFSNQMQEFREGNMLFEIMERNVWGRAGADSAALQKYYNEHPGQYKWAESADVIILTTANEKAAIKAAQGLRSGKSAAEIVTDSNNEVQSDIGRYEFSQLPGKTIYTAKSDPVTSDVITNSDGTAVVVYYQHYYPAGSQRSFTEARGLVVNDYQNVLEQQWVEQLKKKYPVKVNEAVFNQMLK